ncbi:MAG: hypothetical protein K6E50_00680 [Lachnospiraceae bacterium]|nr:hypothetical protein [Lachnospiraceae bacterium]
MKESQVIKQLYADGKLTGHIFFWGIGKKTSKLIVETASLLPELKPEGIIDNFKSAFIKEYEGLPVYPADKIEEYDPDAVCVLLAVATSDSIWKQLDAMGIRKVYDLSSPDSSYKGNNCSFPYTFIDRSRGCSKCVYVLAGYQKELWDTTLARMFHFMEPGFDYCMISSGKYDDELDGLCEKKGWSYLYSEHNQVCYLQNVVVEKHPKAELFIKLDEDMFIGKRFYSGLCEGYYEAEKRGEYRVGCVVPIMPLNYNSYVSYLDAIGKKEEFEKCFGRAYRCTFSAPYGLQEAAVWLWDTVDSVDGMVRFFSERDAVPKALCSLYNIGAFLYSRKRWIMMGRWPENPETSGMGEDEAYIFRENTDSGMATYEIQNVFAGHFAFSGQKELMFEYYEKNHEKFQIKMGE